MSIFEEPTTHVSRRRPLRVAVLGASGSVGRQTLDVCRQHADKVKVVALSVRRSTDLLVSAAREFGASCVAVTDKEHASDPILSDLPKGCEMHVGHQSLAELSTLPEVDCVVSAVVGFAGIRAGYAALRAGKVLAYANKETIVVAGDLLMPLVQPGQLIPVDSEHSAIYQCIVGHRTTDVHAIWLTCSGGPFYGMSRDALSKVTAADALAHPTWSMGPKITVDSASLMNKGLEVLEAYHLFEIPIDRVNVLVQRQSRIHSMVEFADGATIAQLGPSDMRIPIQYALSYPERWETPVPRIDYRDEPEISFGRADEKTFGCLALAKEAGHIGGTMPCVMNAANEVANKAFRLGLCGFLDIEGTVRKVMDLSDAARVESIEQLMEIDERAREQARSVLGIDEGTA